MPARKMVGVGFVSDRAGKLSVAEFKKTIDSMDDKDKSILVLQLLDDMVDLETPEIDFPTFQRLVTAEAVADPPSGLNCRTNAMLPPCSNCSTSPQMGASGRAI